MEPYSEAFRRTSKLDCTLVIMAKAPRPGQVKTRLIPSLPLSSITAFYRCLLDDTLTLARSLRTVEIAIMCPASDVDELRFIVGDDVIVVAQEDEGLAAALTSVFAKFAATRQRRVVAFNSDSPHLPASVLERAFDALVTLDVVVGPTDDGGYYLVGAKAMHPTLFEGGRMGTESAYDALLARARKLQLSVGFTDPFYDIDVATDLTRLRAELRLAPAKAPRTASWMEEWGQVVAQLPRGDGEF
jgi:hypothetical protein